MLKQHCPGTNVKNVPNYQTYVEYTRFTKNININIETNFRQNILLYIFIMKKLNNTFKKYRWQVYNGKLISI